jgi:hypothetical protein
VCSIHLDAVARLPGLVEVGLIGTAEADDHEVATGWVALEPVGYIFQLLCAEVDVDAAVSLGLWAVFEGELPPFPEPPAE